jgi:anti-sigma B factor antagonist
MSVTSYPCQLVGDVPVLTAPAEIDTTTAGHLRATFLRWHTRGHITMVVDLTGTQFCDSAGLGVLARAHKRALAEGGELRLVVPADGGVRRVFTVTGLDRFIPHSATLEQALAQARAAAGRRPQRSLRIGGALPGPSTQAWENGAVTDSRSCEQCGAVFVPLREHARFCSADCRANWNREHMGDPAVEAAALAWAVTAMSEATGRLSAVEVWDQPRALAAIAEAVWWITMVDATLVRHRQGAYDAAMAARAPAERRLIEQTLAGLRFVRNRIGRKASLEELIGPESPDAGNGRITGRRWKGVPEPPAASFPPRGQAWEMVRYRAYHAQLEGHALGETFAHTVPFLTLTGANATSTTVISADTQR